MPLHPVPNLRDSSVSSRRSLGETLAATAAEYQLACIIPHCAVCAKPCCRLDPLVLELDWRQLKTLWKLEESRAAFDRRLASGKGPEEIRAGNGLYYAHRKTCPAFEEANHTCQVYGQEIKPAGCSDFPIYPDRGSIMADLRCEAVDLKVLIPRMVRAVGPAFRIVSSPDQDFPFLVSLLIERKARAGKTKGRK